MRQVIITSILQEFDQKKQFFGGSSCFKLSNLELVLGMALKFDTNVSKELKIKVRKHLGAN